MSDIARVNVNILLQMAASVRGQLSEEHLDELREKLHDGPEKDQAVLSDIAHEALLKITSLSQYSPSNRGLLTSAAEDIYKAHVEKTRLINVHFW